MALGWHESKARQRKTSLCDFLIVCLSPARSSYVCGVRGQPMQSLWASLPVFCLCPCDILGISTEFEIICRRWKDSDKLLLLNLLFQSFLLVFQISLNTEFLFSSHFSPVASSSFVLFCSYHIVSHAENGHWQLKKLHLLAYFFPVSKVSVVPGR